MITTNHDVLVVGGGPAGAAASATLASAGADVVLVDKAQFPRDKTCGDALTTMALRSLDSLGITPADISSWTAVHSAVVHPPAGRSVRLELPDDGRSYAAIARRSDLDAALLERAAACGATLHLGRNAGVVTPSNHTVDATFSDGARIRVRHVIVASGAGSHRRAKADMHATRVYVDTRGSMASDVHVVFLPGIIPGYAWVFPVGRSGANVGVAIHNRHHPARKAVAATKAFLESRLFRVIAGEDARPSDRIRSWPIPTKLALHRPLRRTLYVGDAAGLADPMTGEGIGQALRSGVLAAQAIIQAEPGADAAPIYRRMALGEFGTDHAASRLGTRALAHERSAAAAIRFMGSTEVRRNYFARWMWEETARSSVLSPRTLVRRTEPADGVGFPEPG